MSTEKDAVIDFCNAIEAACVNLRVKLGDKPTATNSKDRVWDWNPAKINWQSKTGAKGPFEMSNDPQSADYANMLNDLAGHQGKLNRDGYFYWTFSNGGVGRKKVNAK